MTTLALACARDEGLQIVTDNQPLHRCLAQGDIDWVFDTWITRAAKEPARPGDLSERKLAVAVFECADVSRVTPKSLRKLHESWEPRLRFLEKLRELAATIPPMRSVAREQERIQALASKTFEQWEQERKKFGLREIFPDVSKASIKEIGRNLLNHLMVPTVSAGVVGAAEPNNCLAYVGMGFAVGFG